MSEISDIAVRICQAVDAIDAHLAKLGFPGDRCLFKHEDKLAMAATRMNEWIARRLKTQAWDRPYFVSMNDKIGLDGVPAICERIDAFLKKT